MSRFRHRRRRPDPDGPAARLAQGLLRRRPRRRRHQGRAGEGRGRARPGRLRDHGPGAAGRRRADPGPPGRGQGRHPDDRAGADHQQGLPVRPRRDRAGRPADPRRRVRHRGRRRHGVDDPGAAPAAQVAARAYKYGDVELVDSHGATTACSDAFRPCAMGESTERCNAELGITREDQDAFSARSHQRAAEAAKNGVFDDEIVPVEIPQRKGDPVVFSDDEGIRADTTAETAGQAAPGVRQGRHDHGRLVVADLRRRRRRRRDEQGQGRGARADLAGRDRRARRRRRPGRHPAVPAGQRDHGTRLRQGGHRRPPTSTWSRSTRRSPRSASSRCATSAWTDDKVNVNGGAIALGHPIGMSGARLALHLALELQRRGGGVGAAALCGGGGQGDALILRVPGRLRRGLTADR